MSYFDDVLALNRKFDFPYTGDGGGGPHLLPDDIEHAAIKHLREEVDEFEDACAHRDLPAAIDALVDIVVVALNRAAMMRVNFDAHWAEVDRANRQKERVPDAAASKRGSELDLRKPEDWTPPDHKSILEKSSYHASLKQQAACYGDKLSWSISRTQKWDENMIGLAREVATWSKDPTTQVGAVIRGIDPRHIATGYNGFPPGIADTPERLNDRAVKHRLIQHAERNVLDNAAFDVRGATLITTMFPCVDCAKSIISRKIACVVVPETGRPVREPWIESAQNALELFQEAGVQVRYVSA
jgi:dCMP deaminase